MESIPLVIIGLAEAAYFEDIGKTNDNNLKPRVAVHISKPSSLKYDWV